MLYENVFPAAKERFRARELVQKAWELGNTGPLEENLRQLVMPKLQ